MAPDRSPTLAALTDAWLDERLHQDNLAANTEQAYRRDLTSWAHRIAGLRGLLGSEDGPDVALARLRVADLTRPAVKEALGSLSRDGYAPSTRARMLAALRGFCRWLAVEGLLGVDPTVGIDDPRTGERLPRAFSPTDLAKLVVAASTVDDQARFPWPARDRALLAVLAGAGPRASEVCGMDLIDVLADDDPKVLRIIGKGDKERRVPVPDEVLDAIGDYLAERTERVGAPHATDRLFVNYAGLPLTREGVNYHVRRWVDRAGVRKPDGECAHAFRHTYAKGLVANGVPLSAVQQLLGHARLTTTEVYLRMTATELAEAAQAAEIRHLLRTTPLAPAP